jgi:hypothetical protein
MQDVPMQGWENFYVIVGSAAGGLTGLTFVVIALVRDARMVRPAGLRAFVTPTILHFSGVLALASFLTMPHQRLLSVSAGLTLGGAAGAIYGLLTAATLRRQGEYQPVREDWVWNVILPTLVYACLFCMGVLIWHRPQETLFGVAALSLLLLFIGIHNAWDIAIFMTLQKRPADPPPQKPQT